MQNYLPMVKQNVMKLEVFILGGQRIDQKRKKGWWRGRREKWEQREDRDRKHRHLPLLVVQLPQVTAFLLSSRLDSAVKCYNGEVLVSSGAAW